MIRIISFLIVCNAFFLNGHAQLITGKVMNADTKEPLPYCTVSLSNVSYVTDSTGAFSLVRSQKNDTIRFYAFSFEPHFIASIDSTKALLVFLTKKVFEHDVVSINGLKPVTIVQRTIQRLSVAVHDEYYRAFYRQYHVENDKPVRLIEADASLFTPMYGLDKVEVNKLRRSVNYEENGLQHSDHLFDLLSSDPVRYQEGSVLNEKGLTEYDFHFDREFIETGSLVCIIYTGRSHDDLTLETGRMVIDIDGFKLLNYECSKVRNPYFPLRKSLPSEAYTWDIRNDDLSVDYDWQGDNIRLKELKRTYFHHLISNVFNSIDYRIRESFSLYITEGEPLQGTVFHSRSNLYESAYEYDAAFWENYLPLKQHPAPPAFIDGLQKRAPLSGQFVKAGL